jgi:hypothetical protein
MNRIFNISPPFPIPDGTLVSPFLNPADTQSGLPLDLSLGFSLAAGTLLPGMVSKIQVLPFVTQVTFVLAGTLTMRLKAPADATPCTLTIQPRQAVLSEAGSFFQLINAGEEPCEVLYIVSPAYLFVRDGEKITYDDSVVLDEDWDELEAAGWGFQNRYHPKPSGGKRNSD